MVENSWTQARTVSEGENKIRWGHAAQFRSDKVRRGDLANSDLVWKVVKPHITRRKIFIIAFWDKFYLG